ncbi:rhodanese-like domain-containing protein 4A, chloroplastic [Chenopodium quinoa]|uniref:Rhodanese domain-containing protein n=1 Tax=Chenopodium quinoa TaxID=63459 RepID=A0A803MFQ0_CHEQI|nr:rhodanese-like domain-containing protein 4A, chloroplastic [Chenopodium quinoa]XP_021762779.1 rhodanese-like domain-containing protein 4A, chloroplastic [Chenopodium quinoa]
MESLSLCLSSSSPIFKPHKIIPKTPPNSLQISIPSSSNHFHGNPISTFIHSLSSKPQISLPILMDFLPSYPSFASEIADPSGQRINLESILVSINDFFNKYPYFVFSVTFIWLIVLPLSEEYLRKYKFISALNAFKKLRDDSSLQMLDIRDEKMLGFLGSPNLRMFKKDVVQVTYDEGDLDGFLKKVLEKFADPNNTSVCIVDNFDGNSIKVAELLVKNGFKEAYAIKGGISGKNGWREIQQEFLPPSVHVYPKKKVKRSQQCESNGAAIQPDTDQVQAATSEK